MRRPAGDRFNPMSLRALQSQPDDELIHYVRHHGQKDWRATLYLVQCFEQLLEDWHNACDPDPLLMSDK